MKMLASLMVLVCLNINTVGNKTIGSSDAEGRCVGMNRKEVIECNIRETLYELKLDSFVVDLLIAQSKHESGNYTNTLTQYNNLFGRWYSKNDTLALGPGAPAEGHSRFARYPSVRAATLSQIDYLRRRGYSFKWKTAYEYAVELKRKGYYAAPVSVYYRALMRHYKETKNESI
jgi:hypothetical protein